MMVALNTLSIIAGMLVALAVCFIPFVRWDTHLGLHFTCYAVFLLGTVLWAPSNAVLLHMIAKALVSELPVPGRFRSRLPLVPVVSMIFGLVTVSFQNGRSLDARQTLVSDHEFLDWCGQIHDLPDRWGALFEKLFVLSLFACLATAYADVHSRDDVEDTCPTRHAVSTGSGQAGDAEPVLKDSADVSKAPDVEDKDGARAVLGVESRNCESLGSELGVGEESGVGASSDVPLQQGGGEGGFDDDEGADPRYTGGLGEFGLGGD